MVFSTALLARGVASTRSALFTTDFETKFNEVTSFKFEPFALLMNDVYAKIESKRNIETRLGFQNIDITEEQIRRECEQHLDDPLLF